MKRIAAIHDISGFGRCSLTVALPILSAAGANVACLPTAVLSAHTGFADSTYHDLTEHMTGAWRHWQRLGLGFDALYSGFLGSARQVDIVAQIIAEMAAPLVLVDPVMGDGGQLYRTFDAGFPVEMRKLVQHAHIITPNMTEAALLLGAPVENAPEAAKKLAESYGAQVVITGVPMDGGRIAVVTFDGARQFCHTTPQVAATYPGTGDIFASVLLAGLLKGKDLPAAATFAADFTSTAIAKTHAKKTDPRHGVCFEGELASLA
jgi:pyridoxine kinase